ncbi:relaxase/mobilization nuclease family protein [Fischerella sp. NIES-4106]|nr:relaxase/mobilization nuclease family protein [Fischerella sp. NIES-4106]
MIGKIKKGKSFAGLTKYILEKEEAELLCTNLAGETPQDFYRQLAATRQLNLRVKSPVNHISLSFAPGERPDQQQLQEIVEGTLLGMGFDNCLYFAATHNDRNHFHLHIAASRINIDGECVSDWWDKRRLEKVLRNLESQFNLTPVPCSWEVDYTAPSTGQKRRMMRERQEFELRLRDKPPSYSTVEKIQDAIDTTIQPEMTMTQFLEKLQAAGVETKVKVTKEGIIQGISYSTDGVAFQARKLGRNGKACTLKGLLSRGIDFDLERDVLALVQRATNNSQDDKQTSINTLIAKIQNHPQNLSMYTSDSRSHNVAQKSESANVSDWSNFQQQNSIVKSQVNYLKHHKDTELDL